MPHLYDPAAAKALGDYLARSLAASTGVPVPVALHSLATLAREDADPAVLVENARRRIEGARLVAAASAAALQAEEVDE